MLILAVDQLMASGPMCICLCTGSGHRLFLISRKTVASVGAEGGPVEEFAVLGATGALACGCREESCTESVWRGIKSPVQFALMPVTPQHCRQCLHGEGWVPPKLQLPRPCQGQPVQALTGGRQIETHLVPNIVVCHFIISDISHQRAAYTGFKG